MKAGFRYKPIPAILLFLLVPAGIFFSGPAHSGQRPVDEYLKEKNAGNYDAALDALEKKALLEDPADPASIEVSLFRIRELMRYPELHDRCMEILNRIAAKIGREYPHLADRIDIIRTMLFLSMGDIKQAEALQKSLSYLDFKVMGPFKNNSSDDFNKSYGPEMGFDRRQTCSGKFGAVSWFPARPDRTGTICLNELLPDTKQSFFYLARTISVPQGGEYNLILGKTGYTDVWLDGTRIFSDRTGHGFCHDQYTIHVRLAARSHRLLIKSGDSGNGIQLSLRIASNYGERIPGGTSDYSGPYGQASLIDSTYFPALAGLLKNREPGPEELFKTGYLFLASNLGNSENNRGLSCLKAIPEGDPLFSSACYLSAMTHHDVEARDRYLNKSIKADPANIESLKELAEIKISHDFVYEAFPLISAIQEIRPLSPWHHELAARLFIKLGWLSEAKCHAAALKQSSYPSIGLSLEAAIFMIDNDPVRAVPCLEQLIRIDSFNLAWYRSLIDCYEKTGNSDAAERTLLRLETLYPNNSSLKLGIASIVNRRRGPARALPYLTAAFQAAPVNREILKAIGIAYHKIGKVALAVYYLDLACQYDPDNHALRRYLRFIQDAARDQRSVSP